MSPTHRCRLVQPGAGSLPLSGHFPWFLLDLGEKITGVFWASLSHDEQLAIEAIGTRRVFSPGSRLIGDNESAAAVFVLLSGQVKLTRTTIDGDSVVIELRGSGALIGELGALDAGRRIASATAVTPVEALVVPASRFRQLLLEEASICFAVLLVVGEKLRQATEWRLVASSTDVMTRLAGRLAELAQGVQPQGDGTVEIHSPFTQQELADWIGVSRDAVVQALGAMRSEGWIETGRRVIRVHDLEALEAIGRLHADRKSRGR